MNIKKLWMPVFALLLSSTVISAQEQRIKEEGKTEFKTLLVYASAIRCCSHTWRS